MASKFTVIKKKKKDGIQGLNYEESFLFINLHHQSLSTIRVPKEEVGNYYYYCNLSFEALAFLLLSSLICSGLENITWVEEVSPRITGPEFSYALLSFFFLVLRH